MLFLIYVSLRVIRPRIIRAALRIVAAVGVSIFINLKPSAFAPSNFETVRNGSFHRHSIFKTPKMVHFCRFYFTWESSRISSAVFSRKFTTFFILSDFDEKFTQINHVLCDFCSSKRGNRRFLVILPSNELNISLYAIRSQILV